MDIDKPAILKRSKEFLPAQWKVIVQWKLPELRD